MTRIDALLGKIEAGTANLTDLREAFPTRQNSYLRMLAWGCFHGSIDAAKELHEAVIPGWDATISVGASHVSLSEPIGSEPVRGWYPGPEVEADTPARAWLICILKALISMEESKG